MCSKAIAFCFVLAAFATVSWSAQIKDRHSNNLRAETPDDPDFSLEKLAKLSELVVSQAERAASARGGKGRGRGGRGGGRGRGSGRGLGGRTPITSPRIKNPFAKRIRCNRRDVFRSIDGTCNNLRMPFFGASKTPLMRILPENTFEDGISEATSTLFSSNAPLPLARTVTLAVHEITSNFSLRHSHLLMNFGQFTDHDLTLSPEAGGEEAVENIKEECCEIPPSEFVGEFSECFPVLTPDDPSIGTDCVPLLRSAPTIGFPGSPAVRFVLNDITAFIDASNIYGSQKGKSKDLRTFVGGKLLASEVSGQETLPFSIDNPEDCFSPTEECTFMAGDVRSSEQAGLTTIHTLFLREHNRIARIIQRMNPGFDDELIYQTTRKIVGAMLQQITYHEFLPEVLGQQLVRSFGIELLEGTDRFGGYNPRLDPGLTIEFSTAAFRFGHTLIRQTFTVVNEDVDITEFFAAFIAVDEFGVDDIINGIISDPSESLERFIVAGVRDTVYAEPNDLPALNIMRGRDHGIPSYNDIRRYFNLPVFDDFEDLVGVTHTKAAADALAEVYPTVEDIETFPGGMSELAVRDGIIGETFGNIIAAQFRKARFGDRFWFETDDPITGFTDEQLLEIRKASLAGIFCNNIPLPVNEVREFLLLNELPENPKVPCSAIAEVSLEPFREGGRRTGGGGGGGGGGRGGGGVRRGGRRRGGRRGRGRVGRIGRGRGGRREGRRG